MRQFESELLNILFPPQHTKRNIEINILCSGVGNFFSKNSIMLFRFENIDLKKKQISSVVA